MTSTILSLLNAPAMARFYREGHWRDRTIYAATSDRLGEAPDAPALRDRFRRLTWREMMDAADALAADLHRRGLRPGHRVVFWMPDRIESAIALLACSRNGYVFCPSPHRNHTVAEVVLLMQRMRAAALVRQTGFGPSDSEDAIDATLAEVPSLRHVYRLDPYGPDSPPTEPFDGLLDASADLPPVSSDPDRVAYIAFTSGSTGRPKGVMHSDNTLLVAPRAIARDWSVGPGKVVYSLSPFSHNLGLGALLTALVGGAEYVVHDLDRRRESLVDRLVETGTTYLVGVPTHAIDLLAELRDRKLEQCGRLHGFRISGAAVPGHVVAALMEFGIVPQSGYGMTETNAHQYSLPDDDRERIVGTSGRTCPGYALAVFDEDDPDRQLCPGEIGQVAGRGACLMLGYFDDQIATETSFNTDGWFMTGDLGRIDEDGYLVLTGRMKEVIIRGGANINPARIEDAAMSLPDIERAAAVPLADERLGERVCLAVTAKQGKAVEADTLLGQLAAAGLARDELPEFLLALDDIPLMPNGKIRKADIVRDIAEGRAAPIAIAAPTAPSVGG